MKSYDPSRPWVYRVRSDGSLAADIFWYIDDGRPTAPTAWEGWKAARKACFTLIFHGLQDTGRKRTCSSRTPGEWTGTMVETINGRVMILVSLKKWEKGKDIVKRIQDELLVKGKLDFKQLERDRGFLVYLSRTYRNLCPYLKGIHQTLDSWHSGRDNDGWKLTKAELFKFMKSDEEFDNSYQVDGAPASVLLASRLKENLEALAFLLDGSTAKRVPVRLVSTGFVHYGMGDASGNGYGAAIFVEG